MQLLPLYIFLNSASGRLECGVIKVTIYNVGSINIDHLYRVEKFPEPGETLLAKDSMTNMGGKGLNISVALSRSGADVRHVGLIGAEDADTRAMIRELGLKDDLIFGSNARTGHAIIYLDNRSENCIVILGGANQSFSDGVIGDALHGAREGDWLVLQNETNANHMAIKAARDKKLKIALVAAPYDAQTMPEQISRVDLVSMNETETERFEADIGKSIRELEGPEFLITYGKNGAMFHSNSEQYFVDAYEVDALDTTGAGDTFFGVFLAHYANGVSADKALNYASSAAALMVQRKGAATVIPSASEIEAFYHSAANSPDC